MKSKAKMPFDISSFEHVTEDSENKLVGGFSASISSEIIQSLEMMTNNCQGGNCASGCGDGQVSNCADGCGVSIR